MATQDGNGSHIVDRRKLLQSISVVGAASLAGCSIGDNGSDGNGNSDLGERLPTLSLAYWTDSTQTAIHENFVPIVQENLQELGLNIEIAPSGLSNNIELLYGDEREHDISSWNLTPTVDRLDTSMYAQLGDPTNAGPGGANPGNWVNCEFGQHFFAQQAASDLDERKEEVYQAAEVFNDERVIQPVMNYVSLNAFNTDLLNAQGTGRAGVGHFNPYSYIKSEPIGHDRIRSPTAPANTETTNVTRAHSSYQVNVWGQLVHSPLFQFTGDWERESSLAESFDTTNEGRTITVQLKEGGTFHNGDPITAEDVKFTFEYLATNQDHFPRVEAIPEDLEVNVVDETTAEFNFPEPNLPFITMAMPVWGILHKESWEAGGARDNPGSYEPDELIGSGPFRLENFEQGSSIVLESHDGHPTYSPSHGITLTSYSGAEPMYNAFQSGNLDMGVDLTPSQFNQITQEDNIEESILQSYTLFFLVPQASYAPGKFREFRDAIGTVLNRQEMSEVGVYGLNEVELSGLPMTAPHEFRPPEDRVSNYTDDPTGDLEAAQQKLEDEGWGWDDDGTLRYPQDADLSPAWEQGEQPTGDEFPCLDSNGEWAG